MASRSLNKVMLIGNLGKDAETRFTPGGASVTNFSIATARRWKDQQSGEWKEETDWHDVVLWRSENVAQYLLKGKQVFVEGRLQTRSWEDQNGNKRYRTEVVVENLILLRGGGAESGGSDDFSQQSAPRQQRAAASVPAGPSQGDAGDQGITDDDVPF
jgi:single-strand DNA-binding protein